MRTAIYTAVFGGYDSLKPVLAQSVDADWICFTDGDVDPGLGWKVQRAVPRLGSPRLDAKYFKLLSHRVFPAGWTDHARRVRYDYVIWIDGSVRVQSPDFARYMIDQTGDSWAMFRHPWRDCIYEEAEESAPMVKYRDQPVRAQAAAYRAEGFPAHGGLYAGTVIGRNIRWWEAAAINECWWVENAGWTIQDQISFPVVLWRLGMSVNACDLPFFNDLWRMETGHRQHEYRKG